MRNVWLACICVVLLRPFALQSQVTATGTIQGTVADKTGGVLPGASVKATNKDTGSTREMATNDAGQYRFDLLPAGTYEVRVGAKCFATAVFANVNVAVSQT